jgi:hypothetical protein
MDENIEKTRNMLWKKVKMRERKENNKQTAKKKEKIRGGNM